MTSRSRQGTGRGERDWPLECSAAEGGDPDSSKFARALRSQSGAAARCGASRTDPGLSERNFALLERGRGRRVAGDAGAGSPAAVGLRCQKRIFKPNDTNKNFENMHLWALKICICGLLRSPTRSDFSWALVIYGVWKKRLIPNCGTYGGRGSESCGWSEE